MKNINLLSDLISELTHVANGMTKVEDVLCSQETVAGMSDDSLAELYRLRLDIGMMKDMNANLQSRLLAMVWSKRDEQRAALAKQTFVPEPYETYHSEVLGQVTIPDFQEGTGADEVDISDILWDVRWKCNGCGREVNQMPKFGRDLCKVCGSGEFTNVKEVSA